MKLTVITRFSAASNARIRLTALSALESSLIWKGERQITYHPRREPQVRLAPPRMRHPRFVELADRR